MITENASGAAVYRIQDGQIQYLLLKSATSDFWGFPKGHVEGQETDLETAHREIREETSLDVTVNPAFHVTIEYDMKNGHHKHVVLYTAKVASDVTIQRQVVEISDAAWLPYAKAKTTLSYANLQAALDQIDAYLTAGAL